MARIGKKRYIIGITGAFGSGKSTAAVFFEKRGYVIVVLSSFLEKEASKRKLLITRKVLQDIGNEWREKYGSGFLMKEALRETKDKEKIVIDGLRNYGEIDRLKKEKNSIVLGIIADRNVRFERLKWLKRREKLTENLFRKLDLRDLGIGEKISGLQTAICVALADIYLDSNSTKKEFYKELEKFLKKYEQSK